MTHRRPNPVGPVKREVHRPRAKAHVTENRVPSRNSFTKRRSGREVSDEVAICNSRPPARAPIRERSKSAHATTSRRARKHSDSSGWGTLDFNYDPDRRHPKPPRRSPASDKTHNRDASRGGRNRYRSVSRSPLSW